MYRPDIMVYSVLRLMRTPKRLVTPPDLIVEIPSPATKALDLITKRADYESFGVGEYWVVDPTDGSVRHFARVSENAPFEERAVAGAALASSAIPGFVLDLAPIKALAG